MQDHYAVLQVPRNASQRAITKAYRKLALKWHPDKNHSPNATEEFKKISNAHDVLKDEAQRAGYDREWRSYQASLARERRQDASDRQSYRSGFSRAGWSQRQNPRPNYEEPRGSARSESHFSQAEGVRSREQRPYGPYKPQEAHSDHREQRRGSARSESNYSRAEGFRPRQQRPYGPFNPQEAPRERPQQHRGSSRSDGPQRAPDPASERRHREGARGSYGISFQEQFRNWVYVVKEDHMRARMQLEAWKNKVLHRIQTTKRKLRDQKYDVRHLSVQIDEAFHELGQQRPGRYPFGLEHIFVRAEVRFSKYGRLRKQRGMLQAMIYHNQCEIEELHSDIDYERDRLNHIFHQRRKEAAREVAEILAAVMEMTHDQYQMRRLEEILYNWNELGSISTESAVWDREDEDMLCDYTQWLEGGRHHRRWDLRQNLMD